MCRLKDGESYTGTQVRHLQILEVKDFSNDPTKKTVKMRIKLSDGVSKVIALVNKSIYEEMAAVAIRKHDVVELGRFKKVLNKGKNIIMIQSALKVVKTDLEEIGKPVDYEINEKNDILQSVQELKIPIKKKFGTIVQPVMRNMVDPKGNDVTPVKSLNLMRQNWQIKVRVTKKN